MKNKLLISSIRKIKSSYKRFISLLFMALLGVGFFVGIKASGPDMLKTLDNYLDEYNVYDIEVVSTLGLTNEDVKKIDELDVSNKVIGVKSLDEIININGQEKIIKITSISDINEIILVDGKLPQNKKEIVVEQLVIDENNLAIGDSISINNKNLESQEYKIVGVIDSPLYFSSYRGTTVKGDGELDYYTYVLEETFNTDYYSSIYLTLNGAKEAVTSDTDYLDIIEDGKEELESIKSERQDARYDSLYKDKIDYMKAMGMAIEEDKIPKPTWYIFDREDNQGYTTFIDATDSLKQIGNVFPLVFYIIAVLISLISMTRMVDEDRTEIGTLKGLGFSNFHIISKYIMYSFLATTIGGIIGMIIGFNLLPRIVWSIYQSLFSIPTFICEFNVYYATLGLSIALLCICGATIITANQTLKDKPSNLMRPKAPKIGKKIFLERLTFFWNKLKFSNKITIRNIFRYKKRILVTIIGIAGSTALILVGFGLRDSINTVSDYNYNNVHIYDEMIALKSNSNAVSLMELLDSNVEIIHKVKTNYEVINLYNKDKDNLEVNLVVPENEEELNYVIKLNDINNDKKQINLTENKIVLSEKLARTLDVEVGDKVSFLINDEYKEIEVSNIVENYINDYAYMTKETYENFFDKYNINTIFLKTTDDYDTDFASKIIEDSNVSNLVSKESVANLVGDILGSLDSVVAVLIISSAILAFVILYNLSNINISERKREISTLKVLGFYDEEVDSYITKENYFITIIGIVFGLVMGLYLSYYVISTCEPQYVMFVRHIEIPSYIISAIISLLFTIIVNKITHYNLKKIDMVESLKNNE